MIAIGLIAGVYFSCADKVTIAPLVLLIAPILTIFYVTIMIKNIIMEDVMVGYLRNQLEPKLAQLCNIEPINEYETYWYETYWKKMDSAKGKPTVIPIRQLYLVLMWVVVIITPMIVIFLLKQKDALGEYFEPLIYIYAIVCIFLALRNTTILMYNYKKKISSVFKFFDISFFRTISVAGVACVIGLLLLGNYSYPDQKWYVSVLDRLMNMISGIQFPILIHLPLILFIVGGALGWYSYMTESDEQNKENDEKK